MSRDAIETLMESNQLSGANQSYIEGLYEDYLRDPLSVDESWQQLFAALPKSELKPEQFHSTTRDYFCQLAKETKPYHSTLSSPEYAVKQIRVMQLVDAYRFRGHQNAALDPIKLRDKPAVPDLDPAFHQLTPEDMTREVRLGGFAFGQETLPLEVLIDALKKTYCGSVGAEYMYITRTEEKRWIQERLEAQVGLPAFSIEEKKSFLKALVASEGLERYLAAKYPGAKRFSLEGGDVLIPMLKVLIEHASLKGSQEVVLGMAHRGRLNVLINILGKKSQDLFDEFAGIHKAILGTGDVKYHQGFSSDLKTTQGEVHFSLAFNPSHLEIVSPVVMGSVRARRDRDKSKANQRIFPVTIHGDAAIVGQGIVQETLNMSQVRGYEVGGTVRIVINNQIGFTTSFPKDCRSSEYCTDVAKMIQAPIFHVNADDPEAVAFITRLALDYRYTFNKDVFIDLICYRRHGHNEADEPSATQPMMYKKIKAHPSAQRLYADKLIDADVINAQVLTEMVNGYRDALDKGECVVNERLPDSDKVSLWQPYLKIDEQQCSDTGFDLEELKALALTMSTLPDTFALHPRVAKIYQDRRLMAEGEKPFDWGAAEMLAYATLVDKGFPVRISGEDSGRGTFFHRHAIVHSQLDGSGYIPLSAISRASSTQFEVWDSVLSEAAVLAFEYGYATSQPNGLTIWEAQFGDFANGAQVVIDQFISSGEQKWGKLCGLVMLLPHGYEGQGPEHSSARLERYLQLCAEQNIRVCIPSTPAQIFHLLRRQVLNPTRRPLVVMSPKSLLRHPQVISDYEALAQGKFKLVIEEQTPLVADEVEQVVLCSGKVYYDLVAKRDELGCRNIAIIRIEQLYPFPTQTLNRILAPYRHVQQVVWCQEEPQNQGAWYCSRHHFMSALPAGASLRYAGRPASASPAVGYLSVHQHQQESLINDALTVKKDTDHHE